MLQLISFTAITYLAISHSDIARVTGFLVPSCSSSSDITRDKIGREAASSSSALFQTTKIYGRHEGSDEELFISLANEKNRRDAAPVDPDEGCGVKTPTSTLKPEGVVPLIMNALKNNDTPHKDAGMMLVWEFTTDTTKYIFKNNITEFIESCHETADEFPTSFYGVAMYGQSWDVESGINRVGGEDGWIATQVMKTISSDGRLRRWQWEIRKNKRPPCLGCWKVESIGSSDRNGDFEARDRGDGWSD